VSPRQRKPKAQHRALGTQRLIAAVAEVAADAPDEQTLLGAATDLIREVLASDNCGFLLLDQTQGVLRHARSFHSRRPQQALEPIPQGRGIVGRVTRLGVASLVDDTSLDPDYLELDPRMRSELCVPLKVGERVLGVFDAESARKRAFSEADLALLSILTSHVAGAVERLRATAALRESGDLYSTYFTASPLALFVADAHGRYLEVNGAACALTGYSREQLARMSLADVVAGGDAPQLAERLLGLIALGAGSNEIQIRRRDGSVRSCLVHASTVGADRVLGLLLDITDRKEAEQKLRDSEERFRGLSEAAFEAILVHDGGRIVDVNHALCELSGYSWHELVGRDGFDLVAPEYREAAYRNLLSEYTGIYEIECSRRDGGRIPVEVQARSFPYRGRVLRVVAVRDVSERKKAERVKESLIRELEAKNAELERFGYAVTHDLKAPLVTIRGFADYLEKDLCAGRGDRLAQDAARISEAVGRLQRLLDRLFELSRAGRAVGPPAAVPVAELVQDSLRLLRERVAASGGGVEVEPTLPVVVGDRARLVQVFQNLLDNALKFGEGRRVQVLARAPQEGRVVLVVRDEGIGIEARHRERVLDVFERLDPRGEGAGVGLAMVKRIVESHGGRVWLESEGLGRGTAACVELPLEPVAEPATTPGVGRPSGSAPRGAGSRET
jgi:two-component system, LuxR family, sensor kinase FixL